MKILKWVITWSNIWTKSKEESWKCFREHIADHSNATITNAWSANRSIALKNKISNIMRSEEAIILKFTYILTFSTFITKPTNEGSSQLDQ